MFSSFQVSLPAAASSEPAAKTQVIVLGTGSLGLQANRQGFRGPNHNLLPLFYVLQCVGQGHLVFLSAPIRIFQSEQAIASIHAKTLARESVVCSTTLAGWPAPGVPTTVTPAPALGGGPFLTRKMATASVRVALTWLPTWTWPRLATSGATLHRVVVPAEDLRARSLLPATSSVTSAFSSEVWMTTLPPERLGLL